jgi:hypothetical protein
MTQKMPGVNAKNQLLNRYKSIPDKYGPWVVSASASIGENWLEIKVWKITG